jgi:hypothetical protein
LSTNLHLGLPSGLFPSNILYVFLLAPIRATCPAHLILLDFILLITLGEEYKLWGAFVSPLKCSRQQEYYYNVKYSTSVWACAYKNNLKWLCKNICTRGHRRLESIIGYAA